ncbi:exopolysaccharide biosynthesis protein [Erythrobacter litoralis]|uniref:beta-1,4-glucuronosyltransferase WelK n=1 Tax=Erythrobacter litoralis TaxID=39960 RepID=UPI002435574E|nr:glycosyltransferase [Erythrobacter litoralis]MDG6079103.1 exopolysaccharide biosynthesis protein [Erythrobacter litoralis]
MADGEKRLRVCLAASGGGHVRQLLDLEPLWKRHDSFFVTEESALGRSIAQTQETYFVPHVALGQARLGKPFKMLASAFASLRISFNILRKARPDVILTTGAGSMAFLVLLGRLLGARIVLIDSFARFENPSAFAKLIGPFAHLRIAQAAKLAENWKGALVFDPFRTIDEPRPEKDALLFGTVGATLAFPRLVDLVTTAHRDGIVKDKIILQVGNGAIVEHEGIEWAETYPFDDIQAMLSRSDYVVCHGGTGSLITALRAGCRVIAVPRRYELGEHYDNHQAEITENFQKRGLIEIADTPEEFAAAIEKLRAREPTRATTDYTALMAYLDGWMAQRS